VAAVHSPRSAWKVWLWLGLGSLLLCCGGLGGGAYWVGTTYGSRFGVGPGAWLDPYASPPELRAQMPEAVAALRSRDPWARSRGADVLMMLGPEAESTVPDVIPLLNDPEWRVRASAAGALCRMGSAAAPAVPDLVRILESDPEDEVKVRAAIAIAGIGPWVGAPAYDALTRLRTTGRPDVRDAATIALGSLGDVSVSADLARLISTTRGPYGLWAIRAAGYVSTRGNESMDALAKATTDPDREVQVTALWAIAQHGPNDSAKLRATLYAPMGDPDPEIRVPATLALGLSRDERAYAPLVGFLESPSPLTRTWALYALGGFRERAAGCADKAEALVDDPDPSVRREALALLSGIGPSSAEHLGAIVGALTDGDTNVRAAAAYAIQCVAIATDKAAGAVRALTAALDDDNGIVRREALTALSAIGPDALQPVARMVALLDDPDRWVRESAAWALARLGEIGRPGIPKLLEALDSDPELRPAAAATLGRWHEPAAIPVLSELLVSKSSRDRSEGAIGCFYFPQAAEQAGDDLRALVRDDSDENGTIRVYATAALGRSGDRRVIPKLLEQCSDATSDLSFFPALALRDLGHPRGKAVLQRLAKSGKRPARIAARKALDGTLGY